MMETGLQDVAVHCRDVVKTYGAGEAKVTALRGVDLDVRRGELLMLVGPSGCGKTTLISVIAAILDHDGGDVRVLDRDLRTLGTGERARFRGETIGFVFQAYNLLPALTAAENAAVPLLIKGVPRVRALARAREVLDAVGLAARMNALPAQLSGGQQQRVAIARALANDPPILVADEPTGRLDSATADTIFSIFEKLAAHGHTILMVSHDPGFYRRYSRVLWLADGRLTDEPQFPVEP
jgi:putative ABC transport system ATP-binding protein